MQHRRIYKRCQTNGKSLFSDKGIYISAAMIMLHLRSCIENVSIVYGVKIIGFDDVVRISFGISNYANMIELLLL